MRLVECTSVVYRLDVQFMLVSFNGLHREASLEVSECWFVAYLVDVKFDVLMLHVLLAFVATSKGYVAGTRSESRDEDQRWWCPS